MPYEYLEEGVTSDITFHAWGRDLDELFTAAADATTNVMVRSLDSIQPSARRAAVVRADALDLLLLRFLDEIIFHKDAATLLLRAGEVHVETFDHDHQVRAQLRGEPIDVRKHDLAADVKAVTLHDLRVEQRNSEWHAYVTLDV
jgi:protein archease